ncbi:MAG TPA: oligosaccharide flippase family protein [Dongiaceae bacterium]
MSGAVDSSSRSLFKNAISQIGGRLLLSLGRLLAALMIVRLLGPERFGEYALVLQFIVLFEWLADFGQTGISVREICQNPADERATLGALTTLKAVQGLFLALLLPALLLALRYPAEIVRAGVAGGLSVACYAAVQMFRADLAVRMRMERDVGAELGGLVVMLPLTLVACRAGAGVEILIACYSAARIVFLLLLVWFSLGPGRPRLHLAGSRPSMELLLKALPLGIAGLLVSTYDSLATLMLSKMTDMGAIAQFASAMRFVFPVIIVVQALLSAFYPSLAATYRVNPVRFQRLQQSALELSVLVGAGLFCGLFAGADFFMGLMGPSIRDAAPVLSVMSVVVLARSVTTAMSPLIVVAGKQGKALWLTAASIAFQAVMLLALVPRLGIMGAAIGYLAVELALGVVPVSVIGQLVAKVRLDWSVPVRLIGWAGIAVAICKLLPLAGTIWSGILAGLLFVTLILATGTLSVSSVRSVLSDIIAGRLARTAPPAAGAQ